MLLDFRGLVHLIRRRKPVPHSPVVANPPPHQAHAA
jgi:hypothetical protein